VHRWIDDLLPLVSAGDDPLGLDDFTTHTLPLEDAPRAYEMFQKKEDGAVKVLFQP
jgi:threonine dehydrogenase-like Zn-dependent dehydrogenase